MNDLMRKRTAFDGAVHSTPIEAHRVSQTLYALLLELVDNVERLKLDKAALEARLKVLEDRPYSPWSFL